MHICNFECFYRRHDMGFLIFCLVHIYSMKWNFLNRMCQKEKNPKAYCNKHNLTFPIVSTYSYIYPPLPSFSRLLLVVSYTIGYLLLSRIFNVGNWWEKPFQCTITPTATSATIHYLQLLLPQSIPVSWTLIGPIIVDNKKLVRYI